MPIRSTDIYLNFARLLTEADIPSGVTAMNVDRLFPRPATPSDTAPQTHRLRKYVVFVQLESGNPRIFIYLGETVLPHPEWQGQMILDHLADRWPEMNFMAEWVVVTPDY